MTDSLKAATARGPWKATVLTFLVADGLAALISAVVLTAHQGPTTVVDPGPSPPHVDRDRSPPHADRDRSPRPAGPGPSLVPEDQDLYQVQGDHTHEVPGLSQGRGPHTARGPTAHGDPTAEGAEVHMVPTPIGVGRGVGRGAGRGVGLGAVPGADHEVSPGAGHEVGQRAGRGDQEAGRAADRI